MKCRVNYFSKHQQKIIKEQGRKAVVEAKESFYPHLEAMALWSLHTTFGFGKKRLMRWRKAFAREFSEMCEKYQMDDCYPAIVRLKEMGIDVYEIVDNEMKGATK